MSELHDDPKPGQCGICGKMTMTRNPHPDAGKPEYLLTVGAVWECIPCQRKAFHEAHERYRALRSENEGLRNRINALPDEMQARD